MEFTSILDLKESSYKGMTRSVFFEDLNLNQVIDRITNEWSDDVRSFYYYFPADAEAEAYRRSIYADIRQKNVYECLNKFVLSMKDRDDALARKEAVEISLQKDAWHIRELGYYCDSLDELYNALKPLSLSSEGMTAFRDYLTAYVESSSYQTMRKSMTRLRDQLMAIRVTFTYDKERFCMSVGKAPGAYDDFLSEHFPNAQKQLKNPFTASPALYELETEILKIYRKKHIAFFNDALDFHSAYKDYADEKLLRFCTEVSFYLSFYRFEQRMMGYGFSFCAPTVDENREMSATELYDLALACVNMTEHKKVISNDMVYHAAESFFVLTGPNQGGKTTFARSLGQLVYFTKMGLDVPAVSANVPYFVNILTHFSVEESAETGRGKLKEELVRLKPMMHEMYANAFVVINELFTTAANYDACIMGKKVLNHFIDQGCHGIYVTHLKELSTAHEKVVSIKATLDENKVQNFKIIRSEAEESAYAINQVNKYQLTYEQLKKRLQNKENGDAV